MANDLGFPCHNHYPKLANLFLGDNMSICNLDNLNQPFYLQTSQGIESAAELTLRYQTWNTTRVSMVGVKVASRFSKVSVAHFSIHQQVPSTIISSLSEELSLFTKNGPPSAFILNEDTLKPFHILATENCRNRSNLHLPCLDQ